MNEYMKEAERLADAYAVAYMDFVRCGKSCHEETRAALLAHIQHGVSPAGWWKALEKCRDVAIESGAYNSYRSVRQAFDELEAALAAALNHSRDSSEMVEAAKALVPKPDRVTQIGGGPRIYSHSPAQMRTYGEACFSAGYVAGVKAENTRCKQILTDKREHYDALPDRVLAAQCFDHAQILLGGLAYEAALRGEVKP